MSHLKRLIHEIHRKSIWQVVGIYLLGGWIALQVVETLVDSLGLPEWFPAFAVMLLIVGFPIVVATAFVQVKEAPGAPKTAASAPGTVTDSSTGTQGAGLAGGTGSLDRPSTRPPRLYRMLTWKNAIGGGIVAFAVWGIVAAGWMGMNAYVDRQLGDTRSAPRTGALTSAESDALKSVAVLPFANLSTDQENAFFADGIHEDVLTQLSKVGDLVVISRTSVLAYRDTDRSLAEIGQELGVGAIVEGSVRRSGDNVRITAQLIDAETDLHLWADNFDRALTAANVFSIQTEIAQRIVQALSATLSPEEESRLVRAPTEDLAAYEATLRGREAYRLYTAGANDEAIRLFALAIQADPTYAEPWAGLADSYAQRVLRYGDGPQWADSAEVAARRAIELDGQLATAYKALGTAQAARGDFGGSLEANIRAMELDPNFADPMNNAGVSHQRFGRHDEAHRLMRKAYRHQPNLAFARANSALTYAFLGEFELSKLRLAEAIRFDPNDTDALLYQSSVLALAGEVDRGADVAEGVVARDPENPMFLAWAADGAFFARRFDRATELGLAGLELSPDQDILASRHVAILVGAALYELGRQAEADPLLDRLHAQRLRELDERPEFAAAAYEVAVIHAVRGESESAVDWLKRAHDAGWLFPHYLRRDPAFDSVRDEPRFKEVLEDMLVRIERMRADIEREEIEQGLR